MNLPARAKEWRVFGNQVQHAAATAALHAAQGWINAKTLFLLSQGIVCVGSSDGTTAGMDGVDRIGLDPSKVVSNAAGAHSWWVGECVADGWQFLIDFNTANNYTATLVWSPEGVFTGGSTTARPTAADQIVNRDQTDWFIGNTTHPVNWTLLMSADGQNFTLTAARAATLSVSWMMGRIQDPRSFLVYPFYCNQMANRDITNGPGTYQSVSGGNSDCFSVRVPTSPFIARCRLTGQFAGSTSQLLCAQFSSMLNSFTGKYDVEQPGLKQNSAPDAARYGTLPDHFFTRGVPNGSLISNPPEPGLVAIALGTWVLPWPVNGVWLAPPS